jgi:TolB-like protein/Tfp pilus assembly protein PilF
MADIFISYSRRDSEQALSLAERLRASGMTVWIDQHGIEVATSWSKEIVDAIESSKVFVILLSRSSLASANVVKELSIASEAGRSVVPVDLEAVTIPSEFKYQLAGLQRAQYTDFDSILRALSRLGISGTGDVPERKFPQASPQALLPPARTNKKYAIGAALLLIALAIGGYFLFFSSKQDDTSSNIKTLAVLPFESLSADKNDEFFADGMTSTLIDMFLSIPELRVIDRRTSMEFKASTLDVKSLGTALGARYLVSGTVQRQGDRIMINAQVDDAESGTVVFSKSFSGKTDDLLDLQKQIAEAIVVELQLAFNPDNSFTFTSVTRSANPQAHEFCMKADYAEEHGMPDTAIAYYQQAAKYDSAMAFPYLSVARLYGNIAVDPMRANDSLAPRYIPLADSFLVIGTRLDTAQTYSLHVASWIASVKGDFNLAIAKATAYVKKEPRRSEGYNLLGLAYARTNQFALAAQNFTEEVKRDPASNHSRFLLMISLWFARDTLRLTQCATQAIPIFEASLARRPDDKNVRNNSIPLALVWSGRGEEACKRMEQLLKTKGVDSQYFLNTAAISALSGKLDRAMELMRQEVARLGVKNIDFERGFFDNIRNFPEFQAWVKQKEALSKKNG